MQKRNRFLSYGVAVILFAFAALATVFTIPVAKSQENRVGYCTGTLSSNAAVCNGGAGVITTASLSTAAGSTYSFTITDASLGANGANAIINATVRTDGTSTTGTPVVVSVTPANGTAAGPGGNLGTPGTFVVVLQNVHASAALNGTLKIGFSIAQSGF